MHDTWTRIADNMIGRVTGPMRLRLLFQPLMASIFAIRGGLTDAKAGRPPYFWALFTDPSHRAEMLKSGWKSVGKVFVIAVLLDVIYQMIELKTVYPFEAIIVGFALAILPYLVLRGLVTRLASRKK